MEQSRPFLLLHSRISLKHARWVEIVRSCRWLMPSSRERMKRQREEISIQSQKNSWQAEKDSRHKQWDNISKRDYMVVHHIPLTPALPCAPSSDQTNVFPSTLIWRYIRSGRISSSTEVLLNTIIAESRLGYETRRVLAKEKKEKDKRRWLY